MPKWLIQVWWWGVVDGYPSAKWKTIEEHDSDEAMCASLNDWQKRHGKVATYRAVNPASAE